VSTAGPERVEFESANGIRLVGEIDWPTAARPVTALPVPAVVFSHGWGSGKGSPRNVVIARHLAQAGIAAFRIDFTGHGESGGTPAESTLSQQVADLGAALDYLGTRPEVSSLGVAGSSSGGLAAIILAADDPRVAAVVLREPRTEGTWEAARRITAPTLLIQGGAASPLQEPIRRFAQALKYPHRLLVIEGGGHLFEDPATFEVVVRQTVDWFRTHLSAGPTAKLGPP
jgi:pimeloyl-ACP methyl ester carboxylesterase